jgi:hypothetical protein
MKTQALAFLLAFASVDCAAQMPGMPMSADRPAVLVAGVGTTHHSIRTSNPQAQAFFDQGLDYIFAFNHDEARRSFEKAATLDPKAAMPLWGVALAVGPNYNDIDIGHAREQKAVVAIARAKLLAKGGPPAERDYIQTMSERYGQGDNHDLHIQGERYSKAMASLVASYPDDLDAATLYAESLMDLNPWKLWGADGKPAPGTETIVSTLQGVLKRDPNHIGANHFLIHAVEASPDPSLALASAKRLETLAPSAGHLVHMPAHIYQRIGDFDGSANSNQEAIKADKTYFSTQHIHPVGEMYYDMYFVHNIHFLASACSMEGNAACTERAAKQLVDRVTPAVAKDKVVEWFLPTQPWMLVRFEDWDKILAAPAAPAEMPMLGAMWHYARGAAYVGMKQFPMADAERKSLADAGASLTPGTPPDFNNPAASVLALALTALDARLFEARGEQAQAIEAWRKAVTILDGFAYNEPADWYYPVRESLGGALLRAGKPAEAEAVFRKDLEQNRGNGRSLYGLWQSLLAQGRNFEARRAESQFQAAWIHADTKLTIKDL